MRLNIFWTDFMLAVDVNDRTHAINYVKSLMKRWKADANKTGYCFRKYWKPAEEGDNERPSEFDVALFHDCSKAKLVENPGGKGIVIEADGTSYPIAAEKEMDAAQAVSETADMPF